MRHSLLPVVGLLLVASALAGCLGGDDKTSPGTGTDTGTAPDATPTLETGSIKGQVLSASLDEIEGAVVSLIQGSDLAQDMDTDAGGRYTFNGVAPGEYRVQVSHHNFKGGWKSVTVEANRVADASFTLEQLTAADLQEPYSVPDEWTGFIACGVGAVAVSVALCSVFEDTPAADPNEAFMHRFNVSANIKTLIVGMQWDSVGGVAGSDLSISVENAGTVFGEEDGNTYGEADGVSPLIIRIDNEDIAEERNKWTNITDQRGLQFRVFASGANVVYQQPFTIYWEAYYFEEAPEDANPIPDG